MAAKRTPSKSRAKKEKPSASEIAPGVFVGGWSDATEFRGTRICVLDEAPDEKVPAEALIPVYDPGADRPMRANLDRIAQVAEEARGRNEPVLFFCGHGVRRGPLAGAWYLHRHDGVTLDAAYDRIRTVRSNIEPPEKWAGDTSVLKDGRRTSRV